MKKSIVRVVSFIAIVEFVYLIMANAMLNLPPTQKLLNQYLPDTYAVTWERAFTWLPMRAQAIGVSANGQTASQQWQLDTSQASVSLSILPLLRHKLHFYALETRDVEFRVRPRLRKENVDTDRNTNSPSVRDRDPGQSAGASAGRPASSWNIMVDNLHVTGNHHVWIHQVRAYLRGELTADIGYTTGGGPVALHDGKGDIVMESLVVNDESVVTEGGSISARFDMTPFIPSQHRGRKALDFLTANAHVDLEVNSLAFLDFYLHGLSAMEIDGKGTWRGQLHYAHGNLTNDTQMEILAPALQLKAFPYSFEGTGAIDIVAGAANADGMSMNIKFDTLRAFHGDERKVLFSGENLEVSVGGSRQMSPDAARSEHSGLVRIRIPQVRVTDLSAFQHLLPEKWRFRLNGGTGVLQAMATVSATSMRASIQVQSDEADIEFNQHRFTTDLAVNISVAGDTAGPVNLDLAGTYLKIDNARLVSSSRTVSPPWHAAFSITEGTVGLPSADKIPGETSIDELVRTRKRAKPRDILNTMDADVVARLNVSDLSWLNTLFINPFELSLAGAGAAELDMGIRAGWLAQGTTLSVTPQDLEIRVLDHAAQGQGKIVVTVERGGESPDLSLEASLIQGSLKRRGNAGAVVEDVHLEVAAIAHDVSLDKRTTVTAMDVRVPSARVKDASVYNQYLPDRLPMRWVSGEVQMMADIHLAPASANGYVTLQSSKFVSRLGEQQLSGALSMNMNIADGVPKDRVFDISGSSLYFYDVKVKGDQMFFDRPDWSARMNFDKARVVWKKPFRIDVEAAMSISDSRPFTVLLANQRGRRGWIERLLTVEDIQGKAIIQFSPNELQIPYALVSSEIMDIGAKALFSARTREGIVFARYRKISGVLKITDRERDFDLLGARKTFDSYIPGHTDISSIRQAPPKHDATPSR